MDENAPSVEVEQQSQSNEVQPQQPAPEASGNPFPGVQRRIDELTAKWRTEQARNEQLMQTVAQLTQQQVQLQQAMLARQQEQAQQTPDPLTQHAQELDPRLVEVLRSQQQRMEAQMQSYLRQMEAQTGVQTIEQMARQNNIDSRIAQKAAQAYANSKRAGGAATPEEALRWAIGDAYLSGGQANQVTQFTPAGPAIPVQASNPMPRQQSRAVAYPPNFNRMSASEQAAFLEAAGVGDIPLD